MEFTYQYVNFLPMLLCWYATNVIFLSGAVIADIEFPNNLLLTANPSNDTTRTELFHE